jgi:hypothetical protein
LNFPNSPYKVYFRQRIGDTAVELTKLLHLNKIGQYRTTDEVLSESLLKLGWRKIKIRGNYDMKDTKQFPLPSLG